MRILFVDDEPKILNGLRRIILESDQDWDAEFVTSGKAALECLSQGEFDVVVSDMRMPNMDGAELLQRVQSQHPNIVRIVLTGQSDEPSALKALRVAHQFLMKPFDADTFLKVIERTHSIERLLAEKSLRDAIGGIEGLPAVPKLYQQLAEELAGPDVNTRRVAAIIGQDAGISAKILQLANSAFFAPRANLSDVALAVSHLGTNVIKNLVLGVELFDAGMKRSPRLTRFAERLQATSIDLAKICSILTRGTPLHQDAFTGGLLLDIGQLALAMINDRWIDTSTSDTTCSVLERERAEFGATHADVGAFLLGIWGLPFSVVEAVATHHEPPSGLLDSMSMTSIARVAVAIQSHAEIDESRLQELGLWSGYIEACQARGS